MCQLSRPSHNPTARTACGVLAIVFVVAGLLGIGLALSGAAASPDILVATENSDEGLEKPARTPLNSSDISLASHVTDEGAASPKVIERLPCGPAALFVACHLLGKDPDLHELIRLTAPDANGSCSMLALKKAAEHTGLYAYGLKMTERDLARFGAVGIAQVKSCALSVHYVTVAAVRNDGVLVADVLSPSKVRWVGMSDFLERWTGHMLALSRQPLTIRRSD